MARERLGSGGALRSRRWDVLVLGSALPGLAAAIRLGMAGHRVLIAEEDTTAGAPLFLREPFALPGVLGGGVLDPALQALGIPPIERRRFEARDVAYQVLLPEARLDVGDRDLTADELVAWGLLKPDDARALTHDLEQGASALAEALVGAAIVKRGVRLPSFPADGGGAALPALVSQAEGALAESFALQAAGLAELATGEPSPLARLRLLGAPLAGRTGYPSGEGGLLAALRKRLESLHAEFRTIGCPFEFVELGHHPGILRAGPGDVWLGRALVVNAVGPQLSAALRAWDKPVPGFLTGEPPATRRFALHLRALREVVPEPLAPRALLPPPADGPFVGPIRLCVHPSSRGNRFAELVASACLPVDADPDEAAAAMEARVRALMPFSERRLKAGPPGPIPRWDDPSSRPEPRGGWPAPVDVRARTREPVYTLPREEVAALGLEGELLLGWRAGDAIREELG